MIKAILIGAVLILTGMPFAHSQTPQSLRYKTLLCEFSDVSDDNPSVFQYFEDLYGDTPGAMSHYWKEVSRNQLNFEGSSVSGWFTLPNTISHYESMSENNARSALLDDCTNAAVSEVDFSEVDGVNLVFSDSIRPLGYGGQFFETIGGVSKLWPVMWMSSFKYSFGLYDAYSQFMAHEIGHSIGLQHSILLLEQMSMGMFGLI